MRKTTKIVLAFIVIVVVTVVAFGSEFSIVVPSSVNQPNQEALAVDTGKTRLTAELKDAMAKAGPNAINIWAEFDVKEYERITNSDILSLRKYCDSGLEKYWNNRKSELLPEEIVAVTFFYGKGVEGPIKEGAKSGTTWIFTGRTTSEINSVVNFPGLKGICLRTSTEDPNGKADPILMELIAVAAKEYPAYKIKVFLDVHEHINPEKGAFTYNFTLVDQIILKHGGQILGHWRDELKALIPPSFELITKLSSLDEVTRIFPNWWSYPL